MANRVLAIDEYETSSGLILQLKPVRSVVYARKAIEIRRKFIEDGDPIEPPEYVIKDASGEEFSYPLTEDLLETNDPEETRLNKLKWAAHVAALKRLSSAQGEAQIVTMLALGVRNYEPPDPEVWQDELAFMGYEMPEDPLTRKAYYLIYFELNDMDFNAIKSQIEMLNLGKVITPERMSLFRGAVQSEVELRFDQGAAELQKHLDGIKQEAEGVDSLDALLGDDDGESVEPDAE